MENGTAAAPNPCCKQLAEKLEKSDAGRKKLRQAISMLKEKLEAADKVMQENDALRRDCEKERERAAMERQAAEKEKNARLVLEEEGRSLKETLAMAIARIDFLEATQAADRKEVQHLRNEVRVAVDGVRAAVTTSETAQRVCISLEKNLTAKVNALPKAGGQNLQAQNGFKALQGTVSTSQKEMAALSTRLAALETQNAQYVDQLNQLRQATAVKTAKPTEAVATKTPSKLPPRSQQQRPDLNRSVVRNSRYTSTSTGAIQVIPGIADILQPLTSASKKTGFVVHDENHEQAKAYTAKATQDKDPVYETAKDGSDLTVQDDCGGAGKTAKKLLHSLSRLIHKEKRAHSRMEVKLCELQQALNHSESPQAKQHKKRKRSGAEATNSKHSSKAKASRKKRKLKVDAVVIDDDSEMEVLVEKWLDAKKNLHSPNLPEVPSRAQTAISNSETRPCTAASPQDVSGHASEVPNVQSCQQNIGRAEVWKVQGSSKDEACQQNTGKSEVLIVRGREQDTGHAADLDTVTRYQLSPRLLSTAPQAVVEERGGQLNFDDRDELRIWFSDAKEVRGAILSNEDCPNQSVLDMEIVAGCFVGDDGLLKPSESWKQEFESRASGLALNITLRSSLLVVTSSIVNILTTRLFHGNVVFQFGSFLCNVLTGKRVAFDTLLRLLSSFLIFGETQFFMAIMTRDEKEVHRLDCFAAKATADEVAAASKLLATLCNISGHFRLLRKITHKILRRSLMDVGLLVTVLASLASVSKQLLSDTVIRCVASELVAEVVVPQQCGTLASLDGKLQDRKLLEHLEVSVDATVQEVVRATLDLLCTSNLPGFNLIKEMECQRISSSCFEETEAWPIQFHEAVEALELISFHMGWEWTYNNLIVERLWVLVAPGVAQTTVGGVAHLLGSLGRLGLEGGQEMPGVDKLRQSLAFILEDGNHEQGRFSFATRLVAAAALLELSVHDKRAPRLTDDDDATDSQGLDVLSLDYVKTVQDWFHSLDSEKQSSVPLRLKNQIFAIHVPSRRALEELPENEKNDKSAP
ncbi:uncharacterized protein LOC9629485 isoform X1 [Selaginella moellendorffii]|uniref:uncharacterized protein LOC9629485 isoform X1 n=2 Tax=Selaginella moellendorffii TaxID=88036 RepID=UPI000D1C3506|nr:uncharacterized protein LOC9629485 isoform X1 [Selaginella moellendorffii]XP_024518567.1 uncharacterized protein LOC9629485 isoform X1 [Selaginella moellendorffii]|eukprot:XP_024518566.1 uncharacterized protein LOC9629485 isoform X1 [Selaginella moellendorffii]